MFHCPKRVKIVNGVGLKIISKRNIYLSQNLVHKDVLHVPQLNYNLISIVKTIIDNDCLTIFSPSNCYFLPLNCFQEKALKEEAWKGKTGYGKYHDMLFLLSHESSFLKILLDYILVWTLYLMIFRVFLEYRLRVLTLLPLESSYLLAI